MNTMSPKLAGRVRSMAEFTEATRSLYFAAFETPEKLVQAMFGQLEVPADLSGRALMDFLLKNKEWNIFLVEYRERDGGSPVYMGMVNELYTPSDLDERHGKNSTASYTKDSLPELRQQLAEECEDGDGSDSPEAARLRELIEQVENLGDGQTAIYWPGTPVDSPDVYPAQFDSYRHDVFSYRLLLAIEIDEELGDEEDTDLAAE